MEAFFAGVEVLGLGVVVGLHFFLLRVFHLPEFVHALINLLEQLLLLIALPLLKRALILLQLPHLRFLTHHERLCLLKSQIQSLSHLVIFLLSRFGLFLLQLLNLSLKLIYVLLEGFLLLVVVGLLEGEVHQRKFRAQKALFDYVTGLA